jgi:DHA1 family bicyclomycin/chloramphenicol resistance-like MFS transporter
MAVGLTTGVAGAGALLAAILADWGLGAILPCLVVIVASIGLILPNGTALALGDHPEAAGSASALVGLFQFVIGAGVAPVVGAAGRDTAVPMALAIAAMEIAAMLVYVLLTGRRSSGQTRRPEG